MSAEITHILPRKVLSVTEPNRQLAVGGTFWGAFVLLLTWPRFSAGRSGLGSSLVPLTHTQAQQRQPKTINYFVAPNRDPRV